MKRFSELKLNVAKVYENESRKPSEVVDILAEAHKAICGRGFNSLVGTIITRVKTMEKSPLTETDISMVLEDIIKATSKHKDINMSKYSYLPWLEFLQGKIEYKDLNRNKIGALNFKITDDTITSSTKEMNELIIHAGPKGAIAVYGIVLYMLGA